MNYRKKIKFDSLFNVRNKRNEGGDKIEYEINKINITLRKIMKKIKG